jgi:hypothetical protein
LPPGGKAGLPDGIFSYQKSQFGYISERLGMENVDIFYGHLEYIEAIWYMLWYMYFEVSWYVYSTFLVYCIKKIWQPCWEGVGLDSNM